MLETLNRMGCGGLILTTDGEVSALNERARVLLQRELDLPEEIVTALPETGRAVMKALLSRAETRFRLDAESWVQLSRPGQRALVLQAMPLPQAGLAGPHTVVILIDLDELPPVRPATLEAMFGLTPAEARLAVLLTCGATPSEVARSQGLSVATVRSQLGAIFVKTRTRRQSELVALVARLSILP
ncbi:helix-turn-helix transcriptional regulator [Methylobacterium iners]|uniref:helix-turn-helix transcriptional regulator n=1 Tax=Methylobacterium iners TaxID=418707 RepID=UPI001EE27D77|nr:helix-turn-helix transcriptional regulator [Methylobacterium iners]